MLKIALTVLLGLILALCVGVFALWHNELSTLFSIRQLNGPDDAHRDGAVYQMKVSGGYYFDEFLAQGGASKDSDLIAFITQRITKGLIPMDIGESDIGCSSFTAATPAGDRLFARNYDFSRTNTCIVYTDPGHGRHASVSTVDLQFIGIDQDSVPQGLMDKVLMLAAPYVPLDGVNDAGLACGIYMSFQGPEGDTPPTDQQTEKPDLTSTTMLRMVLDYATTVEEAVELISAYDLHDSANSTFHYMIADATGRSAVLEWVNATDSTDTDGTKRELNVLWSDGAPYQAVTNYILTPGYYDGEPEESMKGLDRYEHLTGALEETGGVLADGGAAMDLLSQVGRRSWKQDGDTVTVHSVVYDLTHRTAVWVGNEHYGEPAYTYQLAPAS
ncbi:MAG: linear amide C-N hydrolase [Oscillospiraceae bacterium]|nr:linear amide C-N hydrolase [Oscillospiraceae bacterium]MCI9549744.1 linear amide C-N hydrolase [Oscillospiraceae bacterium]